MNNIPEVKLQVKCIILRCAKQKCFDEAMLTVLNLI